VYLAVGAIGFAYHFSELWGGSALHNDAMWVEITEALAIVAGAFLLLGRNWARWLAVAWMAFHVVLSAFHSAGQCAVHALFLAIIAWFLFRRPAAGYFRERG
jgi:hypothetical protein